MLKETLSHRGESTKFKIWPSDDSKPWNADDSGIISREEEKLDDILTFHRGGNCELVLPFSQLVLQQSLCGWILLQTPQSRDPRNWGVDHHATVRCPHMDTYSWWPSNTCTQPSESGLDPAKGRWKETTEWVSRIKGSIYTSSVPFRLCRVSRQYKSHNHQSVANSSALQAEWCTQNSILCY